MDEREQRIKKNQLKMLQKVFDTWIPATPAFRPNHEGVPEGMVPYISCSDVHDYKYNIRVIPSEEFFSQDGESYEKKENSEIIAHYDSLEDLVEDGWVLD
jgi:hypothetical protein